MAGAKRSLDLDEPRRVGRFEMFSEIASGGFASIHLGRTVGLPGFAKTVAIKRLHRQYARNPDTRRMFLDEARVVARIEHPNVVSTLDLIEEDDELFLVMEFVMGVSLAHLLKRMKEEGQRIPIGIVLRVMSGALEGLHAAHQAVDEHGEPMCVIHRDVTPDNILVGIDGHARLLDFGVARAMGQHYATREGEVKGKLAFLSPEQVHGEEIDHRTDIFSASAVLWECLTGRRLFVGRHFGELIQKIAEKPIEPPSTIVPELSASIDSIVMRGLERDPAQRWSTALRMAEALEALGDLVSSREAGKWVREVAAERVAERFDMRVAVERAPRKHDSTIDQLAGDGRDQSGSRPLDEAIDELVSELEDDWAGLDPDEGEAVERRSAGVGERPETSGERPVQELVDAAVAGLDDLSASTDEELLGGREVEPLERDSVPPPSRRGATASVSRANQVFIGLGALAFLAVIGALVAAELRDPARSPTAPSTAAMPGPSAQAPSASRSAQVPPAAAGAGGKQAADLDGGDRSTAAAGGGGGATPARPAVRQPGSRPSEFTPGGI